MEGILLTAYKLAQILERLKVPYFIAGSFASSVHGVPRATQDLDFVVALDEERADALVSALREEFFVDAESVWDAVRRHDAFNIVRWATMDKVDVFVRTWVGWDKEQFERCHRLVLPLGGETVGLFVASPEDTMLHKLLWFQAGGGVSERQWQDIVGIIRVQKERLDTTYLRRTAAALGLTELLYKAWKDATGEPLNPLRR